MYQIQLPMTYVWHTQNFVCKLPTHTQDPQTSSCYYYHVPPPPSSPAEAFSDIISRSQALILSIPSPLPNVIMLGNFNFPDIIWTNPDMSYQYAIPLISLSDCLFVYQQVLEPTRKSNILDLTFSLDDVINAIDVTDSVLSDHRIIIVKTSIPLCHSNPICKSTNHICNAFEPLDFRKVGQVFVPLLN